ncbi:MAG: response regulator transcription factor [Nitrospira sp.]|nr:response regulator transcription factor [Nitrospira sp.]
MPIQAASYAQPSTSHRPLGRCLRLLLVDDHHMVRQALRSHVARWSDIELVGEAVEGEEAVRQADILSPDVVVMDIRMPRINGIEATRLIVQAHPSVFVIGLSFEVGTPREEALLKAGACMVIDKGALSERLHHTIVQAVELYRVMCSLRGRSWFSRESSS